MAEATFTAEYRRIEADMRRRVRTGQWRAGAMLPSRRDLAEQYRVSSVTINRALLPLITDGLLRADDRRGTFVADTGVEDPPASRRIVPRVFGIVAAFEPDVVTQDAIICQAMEQELTGAGHRVTVCNRTKGDTHVLRPLADAIQILLDEGVDAVAVISLDLDRVQLESDLERIDFRGVPAVFILAGELRLPLPHIFYDNRIAGYQAARFLLDHGFAELTVVAPFTATWVAERIRGIEDACAQAGLPAEALHVITGDAQPWSYQGDPVEIGRAAVRSAMVAGWTPHGGIICLNDLVALGVNWAVSETGCEPGRDYAILGFDDHPAAAEEALTTLRPPLEAMGREAVRLLGEELAGSHAHQVRLKARLVLRASTEGPAQS